MIEETWLDSWDHITIFSKEPFCFKQVYDSFYLQWNHYQKNLWSEEEES
jgi:hypothetical protein